MLDTYETAEAKNIEWTSVLKIVICYSDKAIFMPSLQNIAPECPRYAL